MLHAGVIEVDEQPLPLARGEERVLEREPARVFARRLQQLAVVLEEADDRLPPIQIRVVLEMDDER